MKLALPKPHQIRKPRKAFKVMPDGREICTNTHAGIEEYKRRRNEMWERDCGICCLCGKFVPRDQATFEHRDGRGMGGSRRDDRTQNNGIAHKICNYLKGSKRDAN